MAKTWKKDSGSIFITLGASNHTDKEREQNDYYATDPVAIDKLLTVETPSQCVWEPAVGGGHLAERLKFLGHTVYASDIVDRGYLCELGDFLTATATPFEDGKGDIITNPPYKLATEFVLKALDLLSDGNKCYMFLKLTFLEGKARYNKLFKNYPPKHIYAFSERVPCAKNADFDGMRASGGSAVAFAWFVWEKGYHGTPRLLGDGLGLAAARQIGYRFNARRKQATNYFRRQLLHRRAAAYKIVVSMGQTQPRRA